MQLKKLSNKNITEEYINELPTHTTNHLIFKNIYFKGNNNTWICQDYDEISEDSLLSSNESLPTINKKEYSINHVENNISGTDSTKKENEKGSGEKPRTKIFHPFKTLNSYVQILVLCTKLEQIFPGKNQRKFFNSLLNMHERLVFTNLWH